MSEISICSSGKTISRVFVEEEIGGLESHLANYRHVFTVMDSNVAMQCPAAQELAQIMNRKGVPGKLIDASEETKTLDTVADICGWLLDSGADRDALVLAVGGGVTSDVVGFAASIYKRGVRFANVPTTLLSQVDAAIGGKTGVNFERYKNILGVIRQPEFTFICPQVLDSLPHRDFISGAAEMLKTFIIEDGGWYAKATEVLAEMHNGYAGLPEDNADEYWSDSIYAYSKELTELIAAAVRVKAGVVSRDQFEKGERRKLNLGHTFAHAIETLSRYKGMDMTHGEAVSIGLVLAARLAEQLTHAGRFYAESGLAERIEKDLSRCGLPVSGHFHVDDMATAMSKDKKAEAGQIHFVLPKTTGEVEIVDLTVNEVCQLLA